MDNDDIDRIMASLGGAFAVHEASAAIHVEPLARLLQDNPDKAISQIVETYNLALDGAYTDEKEGNMRAFVEGVAGGPCETILWALYNSIGVVYPFLERPQRNKALGETLKILDKRNYMEVNGETSIGHTTGIREPLLLSDIAVVRRLYWPGLHDEDSLWKKHLTFSEFQNENMSSDGMFRKERVRSDFLVAYALLRSDFTSFGEDYAKIANSEFLERTLQGIVAMRFARLTEKNDIEKGLKRLKQLLPVSLHDRIDPLREKADWVDYKLFL